MKTICHESRQLHTGVEHMPGLTVVGDQLGNRLLLDDLLSETCKVCTVASGQDAIAQIENGMGQEAGAFLLHARELAYSHHEKSDGAVCQQARSRKDVPLSARLMATDDVYDTLISVRPYKQANIHEKVFEVIREGRGMHSDPDVMDAFLQIHLELSDIARRFSDVDSLSETSQGNQ